MRACLVAPTKIIAGAAFRLWQHMNDMPGKGIVAWPALLMRGAHAGACGAGGAHGQRGGARG